MFLESKVNLHGQLFHCNLRDPDTDLEGLSQDYSIHPYSILHHHSDHPDGLLPQAPPSLCYEVGKLPSG